MKIARWFLRKRTEQFVQLAERDDIRAVGPLAEALRSWDTEIQRIAEQALIRLLPRLRSDNDMLLTLEQRKCLYRALRGKNVELSLSILSALKYMGDFEALPHVQRLASLQARTSAEHRLRDAAQYCLPILEERIKIQHAVTTLLRASEPFCNPETSLRASDAPCVPADSRREPEEVGRS